MTRVTIRLFVDVLQLAVKYTDEFGFVEDKEFWANIRKQLMILCSEILHKFDM